MNNECEAEGVALDKNPTHSPKTKKKKGFVLKKWLPFYIILIPAVVIVFVFQYMPMQGILLACKDFNPREGVFGSPWADFYGFGNFVELFKTPALSEAIWTTFYWNVINLAVNFPLPIILAFLLAEVKSKPFKTVTQTISYLPHFLSVAAVTGIVNALLNEYGLINTWLFQLGYSEGQHLLENTHAFLPTYVITNVWMGLGWSSILYVSALSGVSQDLYEAAELDGASRFRRAISIALPSIAPTIAINLILKVGSVFDSSFDLVYGLQNPVGWTQEVIATAVYKFGIGRGEYSVASALNLFQGVVAFCITMFANQISKKLSGISMW